VFENQPLLKEASVLSKLLDSNITSLIEIGGGRNSRIFKFLCDNRITYVGKFYFYHELDQRDRLTTEFTCLDFLWKNNIRCIPEPIKMNRKEKCAVYQYIEGRSIKPEKVTISDTDDIVHFLTKLKELRWVKGSEIHSHASEACFSVKSIARNIKKRLDRLSHVKDESEIYLLLFEFLLEEFVPSFHKIIKWCRTEMNHNDISWDKDIQKEEITLSPSDYGFHNILLREDNRLIFLDFEYFGWDDPAKMICDFLLHPANNLYLNEHLKNRFVSQILVKFKEFKYLSERMKIVYPLYGLKWCMIFLNEFVPEHLSRRQFSSKQKFDRNDIQLKQLVKARKMLNKIMNEYENFPYRN